MRKSVLAVLIIAMVLAALAPMLVLHILSAPRESPLERARRELAASVERKIVKISDREYALVKPLTWFESTLLSGSLYDILPVMVLIGGTPYELLIDISFDIIHRYGVRNCTVLRHNIEYNIKKLSFMKIDKPDDYERLTNFLFGNECYWLLKMFSYEESWYASLTAIQMMMDRYLSTAQRSGNYAIYSLSYIDVGEGGIKEIRVKFYNIANEAEKKEMLDDVWRLARSNAAGALFIMENINRLWHDLFYDITSRGGRIVIIKNVETVFYGFDSLAFLLELAPKFAEDTPPEYIDRVFLSRGAVYVSNGRVVRVYSSYCDIPNVECVSRWS